MFSLSGLSFSPLMAPLAILAAPWLASKEGWRCCLTMPGTTTTTNSSTYTQTGWCDYTGWRGLKTTYSLISARWFTHGRTACHGTPRPWRYLPNTAFSKLDFGHHSQVGSWYELGVVSRGRPQNAVGFLIFSTKVARTFWPTVDQGWWNCSISHILWCSWFVMFVEDMRFSIWHIMAIGSLLCSFVWSGGLPGLRNGLYRLPYRGFKGGVAQIFWMGRFTGSKRFSTSRMLNMRGPVDSLDMETWLFFADQQHIVAGGL